VDSLSADEMREYRGTLTEPGKDSPYRTRSVEENLELFRKVSCSHSVLMNSLDF
jgi:glutaminyl-tRNA synthetase